MPFINIDSEDDTERTTMREAQAQLQLILEEVNIDIESSTDEKQSQVGYKIGMTLPNGKVMYNWQLKVYEMVKLREAGAELYSSRYNEESNTNEFSAQVVVFSKETANKIWDDIFVPQLMAALMTGKLNLDEKGQ